MVFSGFKILKKSNHELVIDCLYALKIGMERQRVCKSNHRYQFIHSGYAISVGNKRICNLFDRGSENYTQSRAIESDSPQFCIFKSLLNKIYFWSVFFSEFLTQLQVKYKLDKLMERFWQRVNSRRPAV